MERDADGTRQYREIYRFGDEQRGGVGWIANPRATMQRASHALAVDGEVWVVDPVDVPGLDDLLAEFGEVAGVTVLLDRHKRDAAAVAERHDVAVHLPDFMAGIADEFDAEPTTYRRELGDTGYGMHKLVDNRFWKEGALYGEDTHVLVVPESLGTETFFCVGDEPIGVHTFARLTPPTKLGRLEPERILVGHGVGIHEDAPSALTEALRTSRGRAPRAALGALLLLLPF